MKNLQQVIYDIVDAHEYGYRGTNGPVDILREYVEEVIDACADTNQLQVLGQDYSDKVWIHRDSIRQVKHEIV